MIFEATIAKVVIDNKGNDKPVKESYVVKDKETFTDVDLMLYQKFGSDTGFDVVAIKKSRIVEIANTRADDGDLLWLVELQYTFVDDNGGEKFLRYRMLLFAPTFDSAKSFINEYIRQGYTDMTLVSLKLTKFLDVIQ